MTEDNAESPEEEAEDAPEYGSTPLEAPEKIKEHYERILREKDRRIKQLEEENKVILAAAIRQSKANQELQEEIRLLEKFKNQLKNPAHNGNRRVRS